MIKLKSFLSKFLSHMAKSGFKPVMVDDGESLTKINNKSECIELLLNLDEAYVRFKHDTLKTSHVVFFVFESQEYERENILDILTNWGFFNGDDDNFDKSINEFMKLYD